MNKIKLDKKCLLIVPVLLGLFVFGGCFKKEVVQKEKKEQQEQLLMNERENDQIEEVDVSNWKTYTSEGWGYSIKYPPELFIKTDTQGDKVPGDDCPMCGHGGQTLIISDIEKMGIQDVMPKEKVHIEITTLKNDDNLTLLEYLKKQTGGTERLEEININNNSGIKIKEENKPIVSYFLIKDSWVYHLHGINYVDKSAHSNSVEVMRNILSTFQFTN